MKEKNDRVEQIKKIERYLRSYNTYKIGIVTLQKQLDYIMPSMVATYELASGSSGTFNISSKTESYAIDRIESKRALIIHEEISEYKMYIESIDIALDGLEETEKRFIVMRYFDKEQISKIAVETGFTEKYIFTIRNRALNKLLISLSGLLQF